MTHYYRNTENGKVLTEAQYKEMKKQIKEFKKVSDEPADQTEWLLAKIAAGDLNDYSVFYEMEDAGLTPDIPRDPQYTLVVIQFDEEAHCLELFKKLKINDLKPEVLVKQVMLIQRDFDEKGFTVIDFENMSGEKKAWRDSILGMVIGFIGGPLGAIFGWAIGDVIGFEQVHHSGKTSKNIFHYVANCIPKGKKGILAIVQEKHDEETFNQLVENKMGGTIERFEISQLKEDIQSLKK